MKLISVKVLGNDFRSLSANHLYKFNISNRKARLSTKCFTGLNGSGKSNMLELISEVFYFLDYYHLVHGEKAQKQGKGFGFEIEYILPMSEINRELLYGEPVKESEWMHVKITKPLDEAEELEFSLKPKDEDNISFRTVSELTNLLLPTNIIAYTSGQNELLSNPFYKLKFHYFKEVSKLKGHFDTSDRMFFIDDVNNYNVFLSNFLMGDDKKLDLLKGVYEISDINSFRLTINHEYIEPDNKIHKVINKLKACSTCWDIQQVYGKKSLKQFVLDFLVDENTKKAFKFHFNDSSIELFKALYQLEMLNLQKYSKKVKDLINKAPKWLNVSDELQSIDSSEQVFRVENIIIDKIQDQQKNKTIPISYKNLSDGEHQFNEVVGSMMLIEEPGCLLLFDEPDTHFNPMWRAKFIEILNQMAAVEYVEGKDSIKRVLDQEVIITTHSPFAISDSYPEDVYVFHRTKHGVEFNNPNIKTYGASVGAILENIFDRDKSISNLAYSDLDIIKKQTRNKNQIQKAKESLFEFGESIEKFDAISYLFEKEREMDERAKKRASKK